MPSYSDTARADPVAFEVMASTGSYAVVVEPGSIARTVAEQGEERVYVVDALLAAPLLAAGLDPIVIESTEAAKSLDRMADLIVALRERRATRRTTLVAIGGGVVQDAAAFVASTYMRGIPWIYAPTTLLSMTDSCIGGKSSINVRQFKNIVGTFHPPVRIVVDSDVTRTLSPEQKAAGLCEAVKIALCRGPATLERYLALDPQVDADPDRLTQVIALSLSAKKWFIEVDEFDRAERLLLNFGHTFGHAIEAATDFGISHGIGVGLGMLAALRMGEALGRDYGRAPHIARFRDHVAALIATAPDMPAVLRDVDPARLMAAFQADKKHWQDRFAVIVATEEGTIERIMIPRDERSTRQVEQAFAAIIADHGASSGPSSDMAEIDSGAGIGVRVQADR